MFNIYAVSSKNHKFPFYWDTFQKIRFNEKVSISISAIWLHKSRRMEKKETLNQKSSIYLWEENIAIKFLTVFVDWHYKIDKLPANLYWKIVKALWKFFHVFLAIMLFLLLLLLFVAFLLISYMFVGIYVYPCLQCLQKRKLFVENCCYLLFDVLGSSD